MEKTEEVVISPIQLGNMDLALSGDSSLIMNRFSEREKQAMVNKQTKTTTERKSRNLKEEVYEKIHRLPTGNVGFPVVGFKKAMVEAAPYLTGMNKKLAKGAFLVLGEGNDLVPITFDNTEALNMRGEPIDPGLKGMLTNVATVKLSGPGSVSMVRFRPEFTNWSCILHIRYNTSQISVGQIVNLANLAGFHIGIGDWTPQHNGQHGMFHVELNGHKEDGI